MKKILFFIFTLILISCGGNTSNAQSTESTPGKQPPPMRTESQYITAEMKLETDAQLYNAYNCPRPWVSKWISQGKVVKDTSRVAEGKYSLKLQNNCDVYYYLDASRIEGNFLTFSGKYRYNRGTKGKLYFYILQKDRYESVEHPPIPDSLVFNDVSGSAEWKTFTIKAKLKDDIQEIRFGVSTKDVGNVWIDDWDIQVDDLPVYRFVKTHYPAEDDKEFDNGSGISLGELTPAMQHNLDVLGRVWGFVKYYHPKVAEGDINWDYELFRVLPKVANAADKEALNKTLATWIGKLGDFPITTHSVTDSLQYSCFIDNSWIKDKETFTDEMIKVLDKVEKAVRNKKVNYYMIPFGGGPRDRNFRAEKSYDNIDWDDQGFRLLTLFRFWNVMEYNFPYKYLTDKPWSKVLPEFIPEIFSPKSEANYQASLMRLTARIDDSHGRIMFPKPNLANTPAERIYQKRYPVGLTETLNGEFCVEATVTNELKPGDIILSIDERPVREIFDEVKPYITASNKETISRNLRGSLLSSNGNPINVEVDRNGEKLSLLLKDFNRGKISGMKEMAEYEKENDDIIFLKVGEMVSDQMVNIIKKKMTAKGIVFDLRQYPRDFMSFFKLSDVLLPDTAINLWFSSQDLTYPGHYKKYNQCPIGHKNPDYFKGKVAILVNEGTQSLGEMTSIALSYAPKSAVIGTTTSGADGNATSFVLPGNMRVGFTVFGAYYPDWVQCQRTGVKIDIQSRATVEDLRNGKDALVERAIQYIRE